MPSIRPGAENYGGYRSDEYTEVHPERPVLDIIYVQPHHVLKRKFAPARYLPEAGEPRPDAQAFLMPGSISLHFQRDRRSRTDKAHVAQKDVDQLRHLVQARLPQYPADPGDPGIVLRLES